MAIGVQIQNPGRTKEDYEEIARRLNLEENPADGLISHFAGADEQGVLVLDVWESQEQFQRFVDERLGPVLEETGRGEMAGNAPRFVEVLSQVEAPARS